MNEKTESNNKENKDNFVLKIGLLGDPKSGKTSLIDR